MAKTWQAKTPAAVSYLRDLRLLHRFIRAGKGDSDKADRLRDRMDLAWRDLTPGERGDARILSSEIHTRNNG